MFQAPPSPSPRSQHVLARRFVVVGLLLVLVAAACSAERPELVQPTIPGASPDDPTTAPTSPLPDRAQCETASGPGPVPFVLGPETTPCIVVASHHRLELVNAGGAPVELLAGPVMLPVPAGQTSVTEPAGTILSSGPNRLLVGPDTVAVAWLAEPTENSLAGQAIGLSSIGAIELGFEPAAVTEATGGIAVAAAGTPCHVAALSGDPYSPLFTFRDGRLVVVQVFTPTMLTRSGIGIGATSAEVNAAYGTQIEVRPDPGGNPARQLLVFVPSDEENQIYRLVFDLTDDRVTTIRLGATEIVADQPGCGP